jgi:hypothetical protein
MTSTQILRKAGVVAGSLALLSLGAGVARAQDTSTSGVSAEGLDVSTTASGEYRAGNGFKLTDDMVLHPRLELEAGYEPNVFYEDDSETPIGALLMRVGVGASLATADNYREDQELAPKVSLHADVALIWNQFLSDSTAVQDQSDLGVNALADVTFNPMGIVSFQLRDGFTRAVNPPPAETDLQLPRDRNELTAQLNYKPGGGALLFYAKATWAIDRFESDTASFANRNSIIGALGSRYQWLPKTQLNAEASFGLVTTDNFIKTSRDSAPLRILVGTSTLITGNFGTVLRVGYGNGFYADGGNYNSFLALAEARYAFGPTIRLAGGYSRDFDDSLIGNYRADDTLFARLSAQIAARVLFTAKSELRFRKYDGLPLSGPVTFCDPASTCPTPSSTRTDVVFGVNAGIDFEANEWLTVDAKYALRSDSTDAIALTGGAMDSVGYVWQEVMAGATAKF